jgi:hypothetical protein
VFLQFAVDTVRVVFIQMRFKEGYRERGDEGAQIAADGRSVAINFDFDETVSISATLAIVRGS